jgi:hypothetical protein
VEALKAKNLPGTVDLVIIDVTSEESVANAAKSVGEKYGRYILLPSDYTLHFTPCHCVLIQYEPASMP